MKRNTEPLKKMISPMSNNVHPEMDKSTLLDENKIKHFQKIIRIYQWLIVAGRFDICYTVSSLSRFQVAPPPQTTPKWEKQS